MTKHTSALILSLAIMLALFVYGCCSHSNDAIFVNPKVDIAITSREVIIDELGRLPAVSFPSGAKIEGLEENTLTPGIVVTIVEQKTTEQNTVYFRDSGSFVIYLYKITAVMNPTNSVGTKNYVTTTEKPIKITLPKPQDSDGIILAGIKESNTDPWRFFNFSDTDEVIANIAGARAAGTNLNDNTFCLFRLGTQFTIVSYDGSKSNKQPETYVTSLNATSTPSILVKDGKYLEDLTIKTLLKGVKLDSINPTDLRVRITYRNNQAEEAPIKINGTNVTQTTNADKTVPGYTYWHSFLVDSLSDYSLDGASGEYSFNLNLNGIETKVFSSGFLLEFFNKVDSDKILPYNYTEFYSFNSKEVVNITVTAVGDNPDGLYELNPTFTLGIGKELPDSDKEKIESAISVSDVEPDRITKDWEGENLTIGFADELEPDTTYTLSVDDVTDIEGISITDVEDITFTTKSVNDSFTITYNLDGGSLAAGESNPTSYDTSSATFTLFNPTKDGYTFIGWSGTDLTGNNNTTVSIVQGSTGEREYVAHWSEVAYVITYNLNGGTVAVTNPTGYNFASETFVLNEPTKVGYIFLGWTGSNGNKPQQTVTIEQGSTGDKTYTAHWSAVAFTITYNLDGGTENTNPTGYNTASATITLNNPTKDGYTFVGWSGSNGDEPQITVTIEQGSIGNKEFTANWSINSYRLDIVKGTGINTVTGDGMHEYDSSVTASCTMLAGYEFDFWSGDFTTETFNMPANNATMTANAKLIVYNINYEGIDGATFVTANPTTYDVTSATINLTNPTKEGYNFTGWSGTDLTGNENLTVTIVQGSTGDKTYTAHFTPISYTIAYTMNDGNVTIPNPTSYDITSATINLTNPTKDYYDFIGWSGTDLEGNNNTSVCITQGSTGNREYIANFSPISFTITYNLDGGSTTNPTTYDVTSATINLTNPTKEGYNFTGWSGTDLVGDNNMTVSITNGSHGDKTYTAHFTPIRYTITYNLDDGTVATANPESYDITSATITLNNPTKDGYAFVGWTEGTATFPLMLKPIPQGSTGNKSFTAHYVECITFTLTGGIKLVMHKIPAGTFTMGSPVDELGRSSNETQHQVKISKDFYMGTYEVTQAQYKVIMGNNPSDNTSGSESNLPVEQVSWDDIMTASTGFISRINAQLADQLPIGYKFDLPTEAQWEYACRAGTTTSLNNNTNVTATTGICPNFSLVGWYSAISSSKTHDVGGKAPNAWGLYDMHGNVWEWCKDCYGGYPTTAVSDPVGPNSGSVRIRRGGSRNSDPIFCRSASRNYAEPTVRVNHYGLRLVLVQTP